MCVLIFRVGEQPLLAANRDEVYGRPFSSPRRWVAGTSFWAPRDEEEGGSWIGVNQNGLMAAITNQSRLEEVPGCASRGHLVTGALAQAGLDSAMEWVRLELVRAPRNPFQLLLLQGPRARIVRVAPEGTEWDNALPGLHVLSNLHDPGEIDFGLPPDASWEGIRPILADPSPRLPRGVAACKRAEWRGTVASAMIEPGHAFLFAPGPPDEVDYDRVDYP